MKQAIKNISLLLVISVVVMGTYFGIDYTLAEKEDKLNYAIINDPSNQRTALWVMVTDGSEENLIKVIGDLKDEIGDEQMFFFSEMPGGRVMPLSPIDQDKIIGGFIPGGGEPEKNNGKSENSV